MKKISLLFLLLLTAVGAFAQEKTIDKTEFDKVFQGSFTWIHNQPHREIEISETGGESIQSKNIPSGAVSSLSPAGKSITKRITEYIPNVGYHSIYDFSYGNSNKRSERIRIGNKLYTREDNGQWIESTPQPAVPRESTTKILDQQIEFKFLGSENLNNQSTNIYAIVEKSRILFSVKNIEMSSAKTTKYWFAKDGKLLKSESKTEIRNERTISNFLSTYIYETDPNIKIEAPNLNAAK